MNNGNLVPTPIVDKNGKQTTVHRKGAGADKRAAIPPVNIANETRSETLTRLIDDDRPYAKALLEFYDNGWVKLRTDELVIMLSDLSPESKDGLHQIESTWRNGLAVIKDGAGYSAREKNIASINNLGLFYKLPQDYDKQQKFVDYIVGLQAHEEDINCPTDYSVESESKRDQAVALIRVALETTRSTTSIFRGFGNTHLRDRNLIQMVLRRHEDTDKIIALLNRDDSIGSRTPQEIKELEAMIDQKVAAPLFDGVL